MTNLRNKRNMALKDWETDFSLLSLTCLLHPLVDDMKVDSFNCRPTNVRKQGTTHIVHFFTAAISKFIETDWFLQIIFKLIHSSTKHEIRGLDIKTGGSWLTVKMFCDQYYQPKNICTRALKSAQKQNGCKNRTVLFFLLFFFCFFLFVLII